MRSLLKAAALGMSVALTLTACGDAGSEGDGKTITFVAAEYSENTKPYWQKVIKDFEAENDGLKVRLQVVSWDDIDQKVRTLVQNRKQPDVLNLNKFSDFAADDLLYKAEEVVSPEVLDDFDQGFKDNSKLDGVQYGLPYIASTRLLFTNTDLLDKAGVSEPPKTWDELRSAAEKVKSDGGKGTFGYGLPLGKEEAQAEFQIWMNGNGGHWKDDAGNWTIDSEANVETLNFLGSMVSDGLTQPNPAKTDRADVWNAFTQGKIAMAMGHPVLPAKIDNDNPDLNYEVSEIPANGDNPSVTLGVQDFLMAFKREGTQDTVRKFLDFVYQEDRYAEFLRTEHVQAATKSANDVLSDMEALKPFIEAMPEARFYPLTDPNWPAVDGAVKQQIGKAVQGADPKQVLANIQKKAQR